MELHITVGIPGSGKSTVANQLLKDDRIDEIVSSDEIRFQLIRDRKNPEDDPYYVKEIESQVWAEITVQMKRAVREHRRVLLDATSLLPMNRRPWLFLAKGHGFKPVAHLFDIPYTECLKRNAERSRNVPVDRMELMHDSFDRYCGITTLTIEGWNVYTYYL